MSKVVKNFVGIDISKQTIDVAVIVNKQRDEIKHHKFRKENKAFGQLVKWLKSVGVNIDEQTVCCMEYTGLYNRSVLSFLAQQKALLWVEMAVHIKRSLGMQRGKTDKVDAARIAVFAYKNRDEIKVWKPVDEAIQKLKDLLA